MRKNLKFLCVAALSVLIISCNSSSNSTENNSDSDKTDTLASDIDKKEEVKEEKAEEKVVCVESEEKESDGMMPNIVKTCTHKNFKSVAKGFPDMKGRYSYTFEMYQKDASDKYKKVKNEAIFKNHKELLSKINAKIKADYDSFSKEEETKDCFQGAPFSSFTFDRLGIQFEDKGLLFSAEFGLSGACMSVGGTSVSLSWDEVQKYLVD